MSVSDKNLSRSLGGHKADCKSIGKTKLNIDFREILYPINSYTRLNHLSSFLFPIRFFISPSLPWFAKVRPPAGPIALPFGRALGTDRQK